MLPKDMILIMHVLWRFLDGFQIKNHQPFCYFYRGITVLWRFLCESLLELKAWLIRKCINIKAQQVYDHNSAYLSAEQPFSRRGVCLLGDPGLALPHQVVVSSYMVEMVLWDLEEGAGVCRLRLHWCLWTLQEGEEAEMGRVHPRVVSQTQWPPRENCSAAPWIRQAQRNHWIQQLALQNWEKTSHLLINYSSIVFYFIFLAIFPWYNWD